MAITVDRSVFPYVIKVPRDYMLLLQTTPSEIRQLDMNAFRLDLKDLEDDTEHIVFTRMTWHNAGVSVGGAVLAKVIVITDDYVIEFEDGQYRVNTVGANTNIGEKTVVNQVSVSTSNSAGLQDLNSLQAASFGGEVAVDATSTYSGTLFPVGTRGYPVNNLTDAIAIAKERGIKRIAMMSSYTITEYVDSSYIFIGDSPTKTVLTLDPSAYLTDCEFVNCTVTGTLDGSVVIRDSVVDDIYYISGFIYESALTGTLTLGNNASAYLFSCYSGIAGGLVGQYPLIDMNGNAENSLAVRGFSGGLGLINNTSAPGDISIDFESGRLVVDSTVSAGEIYVRGIADITNNSTGSAIVYDQTVQEDIAALTAQITTAATEAQLARQLLDADETLDSNGLWVIRDSDTGQILRQRQVTDKNGNAIQLPDGAIARRTKL